MGSLKAFVFIKERERGLLSLAEGRAKSLVPVFGGNRIVDTYLHPLMHAGVDRVTVLTGGERTDTRDHFLYRYGSAGVEVVPDANACSYLFRSLARARRERSLVLRADGLLLIDWARLLKELEGLPGGIHHLRAARGETVGFFVSGEGSASLKTRGFGAGPDAAGVDEAWDGVKSLLVKNAKRVELPASFFPLRTVAEYCKGHFAILRRLDEYIGFEQLHPVEEVDEKISASIAHTGSVKSSYIAHSCVVEGHVENSILFPRVRVGKGARISNAIVMDNNSIGAGALVVNAIVCDNSELFSRLTPNIGESARIGEEGASGANALYPALINGGITMIGRNVEIPAGFTVSRNCYISSDAGKAVFRGKSRMEAGESLLAAQG